MVDWRKYPFIRVFLPFLCGVILGYFLMVSERMREYDILNGMVCKYESFNVVLFVFLSMLACIMSLCYGRAGMHVVWSRVFRGCTYMFFMLFGLFLSVRSHHAAIIQYGKAYKYHIYNSNSMQNDKALELGERMHTIFYYAVKGNKDKKAVVETMTIGNRKGISKEVRKQFSDAGTSHLLALSGFHLSIVYLFFYVLLAWTRNSMAGRYISSIIMLVFLWMYAFVTGMSPSIVRAVIFCCIVELCMMMQREVRLINSCALAAFVILVFEPLMIGHIGFQLSFCSMVGIALLQNIIPRNFLLAMMSVTVICTVFTLPLTAYHFGKIPMYGLLGNILAFLPAYSVVFFSVLWWILHVIGIPALWLMHIIIYMVSVLMCIVRIISSLPYATLAYTPNAIEVLFWYMVIFSIVVLFYKVTAQRIIFLLISIELMLMYFVLRLLL